MANDHLHRMHVFVKVVDCGGFRRAAEALRISTPAVSLHVSGLENHLGVKLLNRTTRSQSLTEDGAAYYTHCQRILSEIAETEALLARSRTTPQGRLRIDVPTTIGRLLVMPYIPAFCARFPQITLEMSFSDGVAIDHRDEFDVMIRVGPLQDSSLIAKPMGWVRSMVVASPDYLARHGIPRTLADLSSHRGINYMHPRTRKIFDWAFNQNGENIRVAVPSALVLTEHEARVHALVAGLGIGQVLSLDAAEAVQQGRLQLVLEDFALNASPLLLLYQRNRHLSAKVRSFVDFMSEQHATNTHFDPLTT